MSTEKITFVDPCLNPFSFTGEAQTNPGSSNYDGTPITFTVTPFTIEPSRCKVTYKCIDVVRTDGSPSMVACDDFSFDGVFDGLGDDGVLKFKPTGGDYSTMVYPPGEYQVTICGTAEGSSPSQEVNETFEFTLNDVCDPPTSYTAYTAVSQMYTITNTQ